MIAAAVGVVGTLPWSRFSLRQSAHERRMLINW